MKKWKLTLVAAAVSSMCLLGGCGTQMYELTDEEQDIIVQYAAHALAKYNTYQKDGMTNPPSEGEQQKAQEPESTQTTETQQDKTGNVDSQTTEGGETQPAGQTDKISLAEAIGHGSDLNVSFTGAELMGTYQTDDAYSVTAPAGKLYLIMKFTVTNPGAEAVAIDSLSYGPEFFIKTGETEASAELTILQNDFSTYQGSIGAGQTIENVLLFAVPDSTTEGSGELFVKVNGTKKEIQL